MACSEIQQMTPDLDGVYMNMHCLRIPSDEKISGLFGNCQISESYEICALLGYYAALSGSSVPTFRDNLAVPPARVTS
jgi:hypothetical protein